MLRRLFETHLKQTLITYSNKAPFRTEQTPFANDDLEMWLNV